MTTPLIRNSDSFEATREIYVSMPPEAIEIPQTSADISSVLRSENETAVASWRSLFAFTTRQHTASIICCAIATIVAGAIRPASAICFGKIFDLLTSYGLGVLSASDTKSQISDWCIVLTAIGVASWLFEGTFLVAWIAFGELQAKSVRIKMFAGLLDKEMEWYDLREDGIGPLLIRIQTQVRELQLAVSQPLGFLLGDIVGAIATLATAFYFSWKLTLVLLAVFPFTAAALFIISMKLAPAIEAQKLELTKASKYASTAILAIETVKVFNGEDQEVWQYYSTHKKAAVSYLIQARCNALQFGIIKFVMVGIFVQGFWYGLYLVRQGMNSGDVLTAFYATLNAMIAIETVLPQWLVLVKGMSAGETLKSILIQMRRGRKVVRGNGSLESAKCQGDIEMNNITFSYPAAPQQLALNNSTFFFPAGEFTFIVGKSGSGKSTISNLIMRYYEPDSGEIFIDGKPLASLDVGWLRSNTALIQQQSVLFNDTILQNVAFGHPDHNKVDRARVMEACEMADLNQTLNELPEGLDTLVGSNTRPLSGGQKQRISIARGRICDAPILIIDEGTSALDYTSRTNVIEAIRRWRRGKTTIIATHDINQILDDDYTYVMERGSVVEEGYRRKLAEKKNGVFASLLPAAPQSRTGIWIEPSKSQQRRSSEPTSPTSPASPTYPISYEEPITSFNPTASPSSGYLSKFLGMQISAESPFERSLIVQKNQRLSLGVGSSYANDLHTKTIWSSPVMSEEEQFSAFRRPSFQFLSPRSVATPPLDDDIALDKRRESMTLESLAFPTRQVLRPVQYPQGFGLLATELLDAATAEESTMKDEQSKNQGTHSLRAILKTVWPSLVWNEKVTLIFGFFAALVVAVATPAFSYIFAKLLNVFYLTENQASEARKWALSLLAVALVDGFASYCQHYALEYSGQAWVNALRVEALKRILSQPKSWFEKDKNSAERLNECLDRNAEEMRNLIGRFAGLTFTILWMTTISIVWSFIISWKLTLVALASAPVFYVVTRGFNLVTSVWEVKCNEAAEKTSSIFTETFSSISVVRALTLENHFERKHKRAAEKTYRIGVSRALYSGLLYGLLDGVTLFIIALVFYYGTVMITSGRISLDTCFQVVNLLLFGIANAGALLAIIPQISSSQVTAAQMLHLANLSNKASHESRGRTRLATVFPVCFKGLSFTYPHRPRARRTLDKANLILEPGCCTALVGSSGSGKSTIASLLLGLYPPDRSKEDIYHATFSVAGFPIEDCNIRSLRNQVSWVSQATMIFPTSIASNITYGLSEDSVLASRSNIVAAAEQAGIDEYINSLPSGYATVVGEGGQGLSGGQQQRIAIARALIRRPKLLVLDEATSALDRASAEVIRETVRNLVSQGEISVVVITHNEEMMRIASKIIVLEHGKVVEQGEFNELQAKGGAFSKLIAAKAEVTEFLEETAGTVLTPPIKPSESRSKARWTRQRSV
ncbi:ABC a-pheromone efflux pump [Phlyctema vagabunda]|uniref:ABC a-pheromone efflux pump n=1 Tax=Phlyctema vagabunda TaxID=108571 RepID=A0ABR4PDG1_9HELO